MSATMKQRMLAGELYMADDPELSAEYLAAQDLVEEFNGTSAREGARREDLLRKLLCRIDEGAVIKPPFRCDYGIHICIGARSFVNYDACFLDCNRIDIGCDVQIAPGVHVYTATHPVDPDLRRTGQESALPVHIGDGAWIGGRAVICPGVTIGANALVGAGSVVTKDVPDGAFVAGVPARILRRDVEKTS